MSIEHDTPSSDPDERGEGWRAFAREESPRAREEAPKHAAEPQAEASEPAAAPEPEPKPQPAGAKGRGAERVSIRSVGRRVRVIGDASVASASVTGPHVLRRSGSVLEIAAEGQATPLEGFSLLKLPRSLDDLKNLGLGAELVVAVNPRLIVDAEVTGSGLVVEGVPLLGRVRVTAGGATLRGVREASDVLVQMGAALVEGPLGGGRSRVKCESGALTVQLADGANVTVRGTASMGRIGWPGEGGPVDEWVAGNGSGRLDVEIVMGMATIKDASLDAEGASQQTSSGVATDACPSCGEGGQRGKFCAACGTPLAAKCGSCGASRPGGAKFCPDCGAKF